MARYDKFVAKQLQIVDQAYDIIITEYDDSKLFRQIIAECVIYFTTKARKSKTVKALKLSVGRYATI